MDKREIRLPAPVNMKCDRSLGRFGVAVRTIGNMVGRVVGGPSAFRRKIVTRKMLVG